MCGIIGYTGSKKIPSVLLQGLKQLEYRGYDSAGIAVHSEEGMIRIRSQGALEKLTSKIKEKSFKPGVSGIGHVRWATHGSPSKENAHPQKTGAIYIVHNGAVENSQDLKKGLSCSFESDTDTEVISALIDRFYKKTSDLLHSTVEANKLLKGAFSYVILCETLKGSVIGCRKGPPLIVGFGEKGEFFISSDLPLLLQWTKKAVILENNEIFMIQNGECRFFSFDKKPLKKTTQEIHLQQKAVDKKGHPHFMLKEIFEQPESLSSILKNYTNKPKLHEKISRILAPPKRLHIVACGSSYYSALYGKYVMESLARIPVEVALASEFPYQSETINKQDPVLFISQSGETADTLASFETAKKKGAFCLTLCNVENSSLDRLGDLSLYIHAGPEMGVASTKTFSAALMVLLLLAVSCCPKPPGDLTADIQKIPSLIQNILNQKEYLKHLGQELKKFKGFLYLGRGCHYPIALEGALKMKELAYIHAEGYPSGEMKHGPLALVDSGMLIIGLAPQDQYYNKNMTNLEEALARKGNLLALGNNQDQKLKNMGAYYVDIPSSHFLVSPLLEVVPLQMLAYYFACSLGYDPDHPRNLAKSVTVE